MFPCNTDLKRRRVHAALLATLALVLVAIGGMGLLILQELPHRQVNELVEVLSAGIGVVLAAAGVIAGLNHCPATSDCPVDWPLGFYAASARWLMAMLQLVAMVAMILAVYCWLLGHPLPRL